MYQTTEPSSLNASFYNPTTTIITTHSNTTPYTVPSTITQTTTRPPTTTTTTTTSSYFNSSYSHRSIDNSLYAVSVKLPEFWSSCPTAWFIQVETQFSLKGITQDKTKFEYVITALPQDITISVLDIIDTPPKTNAYEVLKAALIQRHSLSEEIRLEKILNESVMGNQKPSDLYRSLEMLAGKSGIINKELLIKLWTRRLPNEVQVALAATGKNAPTELTQIADKIWEAANKSQISVVEAQSSLNLTQLYTAVSEMSAKFQNIERQISEIDSRVSNYRQSRPRSRKTNNFPNKYPNRFHSRSKSRFSPNPKRKYCFYHYNFGMDAKKCESPCQFKKIDEQKNN